MLITAAQPLTIYPPRKTVNLFFLDENKKDRRTVIPQITIKVIKKSNIIQYNIKDFNGKLYLYTYVNVIWICLSVQKDLANFKTDLIFLNREVSFCPRKVTITPPLPQLIKVQQSAQLLRVKVFIYFSQLQVSLY